MPECQRCHRVKATAELRRSPSGGHICKAEDRERCDRIARAGEWPEGIDQLARECKSHADEVVKRCERQEVMRALDTLRRMSEAYSELALELGKRATREGQTQKAIAKALDVPVSSLRGLKAAAT